MPKITQEDCKEQFSPSHPTFTTLLVGIQKRLKRESNISISKSFALVIIKLAVLDPQNGFYMQVYMDEVEIHRLEKVVINRIKEMTPIARNILEMQLHYKENFFQPEELSQSFRDQMSRELGPFLDDLQRNPAINSEKESTLSELFYQKLVALIILRSDMGNPLSPLVTKLTEAALESVFPRRDIPLLRNMSEKERRSELCQISQIVQGARLFNNEMNPVEMGEGIPDVEAIVRGMIGECSGLLNELGDRNSDRLILYTSLTKTVLDSPKGEIDKFQERTLRESLVMTHQILKYTKDLSASLENEVNSFNFLAQEHSNFLKTFQERVCQNENMAPAEAYTAFMQIAANWDGLRDSQQFFQMILNLSIKILNFEPLLFQVDELSRGIMSSLPQPLYIPSRDEFFTFPKYKAEEMPPQELRSRVGKCFPPSGRPQCPGGLDPTPTQVQYGGFCIWSLVKGSILMPGRLEIRFNDKSYFLSTPVALFEFREGPHEFVAAALKIIRASPELIFLLDAESEAFKMPPDAHKSGGKVDRFVRMGLIKGDVLGMKGKDESWSLANPKNREILAKLEKLKKCRTHSTQTTGQDYFDGESALKKSSETQTNSKVDCGVQTRRDAYVDAPRSQYFFYGLRGQPHQSNLGIKPHLIELSRENFNDYPQLKPTNPDDEGDGPSTNSSSRYSN